MTEYIRKLRKQAAYLSVKMKNNMLKNANVAKQFVFIKIDNGF